MNVKRYRKKPVEVEALQYTGYNAIELNKFMGGRLQYVPEHKLYAIDTLEGVHLITEKDYIIKGIKGEFYPCKPDVFKMTYEEVDA